MKRIFMFFMAAALCVSLAASCGNGGGNQKTVEGTVEEILERIYEGLDESAHLPFVMNFTLEPDMGIENDGRRIEYFLGTNEIAFVDGIASEAAIGGAFSVCLLRLEKGADVAKAKSAIADGVDPNKWICYLADYVVVENIGDLVILIMTNDETMTGLGDALLESFNNL